MLLLSLAVVAVRRLVCRACWIACETPAAKGANRSAKERMIALNELLEAGLITPEEHARKRVDIIGKL